MTREQDRILFNQIPDEKKADFLFMHLRNLWAVDGLYFLGIEEKYGTEVATDIDQKVWETMGKIEARKIKEFFHITNLSIPSLMQALQYSSWALDLEDKEIQIELNKGIIKNKKCRVQNTRLSKGLTEFACKPVRFGFLTAFAKEFNPKITVTCELCPPDEHPDTLWCVWAFTLENC